MILKVCQYPCIDIQVTWCYSLNMPLKTPFKQVFLKKQLLNKSIQDERIQKAKEYPIEEFFPGELKRTGKNLMGHCPFHTDLTSSFAIYPETNTWHCFSCGETGDNISLYQKINGVSFQEALEALAG